MINVGLCMGGMVLHWYSENTAISPTGGLRLDLTANSTRKYILMQFIREYSGMKVSRRATYGIMAAIDLAMNGNEVPVQARAIARRQAIPIKFLEQVLHSMKKAGLIDSLRGAQGGYLLLKEPSALSVADVVEVLDGPMFHREFRHDSALDRHLSKQELILGHVWKLVAQAEHDVLHRITINELAGRQRAIEERRNPMYHI